MAQKRTIYSLFIIIAGLVSLVFNSPALAGSYTFSKIGDSVGPLGDNFSLPSINNDGTVAFGVGLDAGGSGIFTGNGGLLTTIATGTSSIPTTPPPFIDDVGTVAFDGTLDTAGIFTGNGGPLTTIAQPTDSQPLLCCPSMNNFGTVAFIRGVSAGEEIHTGSGGPTALLYNSSNLPASATGGSMGAIYYTAINDFGTAVFAAGPSPDVREAIFTGNGGPVTTIVNRFQEPFTNFSDLGLASINNGGTAAFVALLNDGVEAIFTGDGGPLTTVATTGGPFASFGCCALGSGRGPSINNAGSVAFWASLDGGGTGIFTGPDPVADKVIATGDPLFGSSVVSVDFSRWGLNNAGQITFFAVLADGTEGIFRAEPLPDLVETAVSNPPSTAIVKGSFSVTDTVQNQGMVAAGASTTRYYLSLDTVRSSGDWLLNGSREVPELGPGESSTGTATVTISLNTALGTYYLLACADDKKVVVESNEKDNNCRASETTVQVGTVDLLETVLSNPPGSAAIGGSFSVTDTVQNQGTMAAGASTTGYYLSLDILIDTEDKPLQGSRSVPGLEPGEISTGTATVTIPKNRVPGTYYLLACADDKKVVVESDEKNNCRASETTVQVGTVDLLETTLSNPPGSAGIGGSFSVTDTVQNQGTVVAGASTTRYYLSLDSLKDTGDKLLQGNRAVPGLGAGETSTGTVTVTIPSTTVLGTYYLLACADDKNVMWETNEQNNCLASGTTVQVKVGTPDLVETAVSNPPGTVLPGGKFSVTDTVQNQGTTAAGTSRTRYYLSLDAVKNTGDWFTGSRDVPGLGPGETSTGTITVTIPSTTVPGAYYLLACADDKKVVVESNEQNNCLASGTTVKVGNTPDLVETAVSNPPGTVLPGGKFSVTDTVQNQGTTAAGTSRTRYYLSLDTLRNTGDQPLTGHREVPVLGPGETSTGAATVTIPSGTVPGTYYLLACADDKKVVVESNEQNNCLASGTTATVGNTPDLVETAVSNPPGTALAASSFSVTDTVQNQGTVAAGASRTRYYLSLDTQKDGGDQLLTGNRDVPALGPEASSTGAATVTIPSGTVPGTYYLLACADDKKVVVESNEQNNCRASTSQVAVGP